MLWGQRAQTESLGQGQGRRCGWEAEKPGWGWGQDPGAGRLHSLPSPTADQGNPSASLFSVFGDSLSARCCLHSGHNRSRQSAKPAPGQRAKAEGPEGAVGGGHGDWNLGGLSNWGAGREVRWLGACPRP